MVSSPADAAWQKAVDRPTKTIEHLVDTSTALLTQIKSRDRIKQGGNKARAKAKTRGKRKRDKVKKVVKVRKVVRKRKVAKLHKRY